MGFRSLTENIATTTPGGKLVVHLFGALAEFERDLRAMYESQEHDVATIARVLDVSRASVYRAMG